jgi:hypothetical protein
MSLVDYFFNSNYRESLHPSTTYSKPDVEVETEFQKKRRNAKWARDYHLKSMRHQVSLLESEILYGFIDVNSVNSVNFKKYLDRFGAKDWVVFVLWNEFTNKHKLR